MQAPDATGFNYLGTIDDVAVRYPWRFKLTESALNHSLLTQVIDGRPVLLNDGYLVQHAIARQAVTDRQSLLWELMRVGYVRVMSRGGGRYGLAEMPERMAKIGSFDDLVHDRIPGVDWRTLRKDLDDVDRLLRGRGHLLDWPAFESASGFQAFARRVLDRGSHPRSLGMGRHVRPEVLTDFLQRFIEEIEKDPVGPRDTWEKLARRLANQPGVTDDAQAFVRVLMNFATETYHYNMGVMLGAHYGVPVSVETQTSAAFDDLLVRPDVLVDEIPVVPRLNVPRALLAADPMRLAHIVGERDSALHRARADWIARRLAWEAAHAPGSAARPGGELQRAMQADLREAGQAYARALSTLLGKHVKYEHGEGIFHTVVGAAVKEGGNLLATTVGLSAAGTAVALGVPAPAAAVVGVAAGYVVSQGQKKLLGGVVRKFRVRVLESQLLQPEWLQRSRQVVAGINARRTPSSIDLEPQAVADIARQLRPYEAR